MLCQNCQKRPATVHFTKVVNDSKVELYLCEQCAKEKGQMGFGSPFNISDFFSGFLGFGDEQRYMPAPQRNTVCEKCGMSYEEFQRVGKMGCENCYALFGDKLEPLLKRLHGGVSHSGKTPVRVSRAMESAAARNRKIDEMKALLGEAVKNEQYEKAAELRDAIRKLEAEAK